MAGYFSPLLQQQDTFSNCHTIPQECSRAARIHLRREETMLSADAWSGHPTTHHQTHTFSGSGRWRRESWRADSGRFLLQWVWISMHHVCNCMCKVTLGISGHSNYSSRLLQTLLFEHSCNTALVVAALNYNIPDSEVRCLLPKCWPATIFSSSERFASIFTQANLKNMLGYRYIEMKPHLR